MVFCSFLLQDLQIQCYSVYLGCGEPMECETKMENPGSPEREGAGAEGTEGMADCEGLKGGAEETDDGKKRKRKPYRPGNIPRISQNKL